MKKSMNIVLVLAGFILAYFGAKMFRSASAVDRLTELKTDHFVITYQGIYKEEAQDIADNLEEHYDRIRVDLNDPDHEIIQVFIHPTQTEFNKGTGLFNGSANGMSIGPNKFHVLWSNWFNGILPDDPIKTALHEFTHCVQLNILIKKAQGELPLEGSGDFDRAFEQKFINEYPQWFWEAICDYEAGIVTGISVKYGMTKNPTLEYLNNSNQIYNVGYTIIEYIVEKWGKDRIPELITSYVDIENVLKVSESEFEKGWIDYVNEKY